VIVAIFLSFGYDDIIEAFALDKNGTAFLPRPSRLRCSLPSSSQRSSLSRLPGTPTGARAFRGRVAYERAVPWALALVVALPVVTFLIASNHRFSGRLQYGSLAGPVVFTIICALWAGCALAACVWLSAREVNEFDTE
jgi:hypothetical protein